MKNLNDLIANNIARNAPPSFQARQVGSIISDNGTIMKARGIMAPIGHMVAPVGRPDICCAEVVGFENDTCLLARLEVGSSLKPGADLVYLPFDQKIIIDPDVGGHILNGLGRALFRQNNQPQRSQILFDSQNWVAPLKVPISQSLETGVKAIDGLLSFGCGQRLGLMSGSGVGKSSLLGMIARRAQADLIIVALIGERGREIVDFLENKLPPENRKNTLVIAAPADQPPAQKIRAAHLAHALAVHYASHGKNIFLMMDSITRVAHAQRELGISVGEPAIARGYPPSTFSLLAKLIEAGGAFSNGGSITSLYTVLVDGDDPDDPILDSARSLLDGHIILNRDLAESGHYPAIDIGKSVSRVMEDITTSQHMKAARQFRQRWHRMAEIYELRAVGLYQSGVDSTMDKLLKNHPYYEKYLQQEEGQFVPLSESISLLDDLIMD